MLGQGMPTREDIQAYAARRWDLVADEKLRFLAGRFQKGGPEASRTVARRLFARWARLHPEGGSPAARSADLSAHVALKDKLRRTAGVIGRR